VQQSGGHIWVYSEPGRGTSFKIYFPRYTGLEDDVAPDERRRSREEDAAGAGILIVEDDHAVKSSIRRLLERQGYEVTETSNGRQALTAVAEAEQPIHLVISDMVMPEMSGLELREQLRSLRPDLPVLLMSGYSEEAIARLATEDSLGLVVEKPFTAQGILEKVRSALGSGGSGADSR
jgi:DNA-binding NtrC family response regulator